MHGTPGADELAEGDRQAARRGRALGRPPRRDDHDGCRAHGVGHEQQQVAGRLVGPVQVLDDDDEWLDRSRGDELVGDPGEEPEAVGRVGGRGDVAGRAVA